MKERYSNFQFFKDVSCETDKKLKSKNGFQISIERQKKIVNNNSEKYRTPEVIIFREPNLK
jgi:hypothetical protein